MKKQKPIHFVFHDYDDRPITEVWVSADRQTVKYKNYTDRLLFTVFGWIKDPTWQDVLDFFESRCFPRDRADIQEILHHLHLKEYDPEALVRHYEGRFASDDCWIEFVED